MLVKHGGTRRQLGAMADTEMHETAARSCAWLALRFTRRQLGAMADTEMDETAARRYG